MPTTPEPARRSPSNIAATPRSTDHAIAQLRAAQIRRQLAEERAAIFVHAPRPAWVHGEARSAWQRTFGPNDHSAICGIRLRNAESAGTSLAVLRPATEDLARLTIELGCACYVRAVLAPSELREIAARLIDAAHDIETHPAAAPATARGAA